MTVPLHHVVEGPPSRPTVVLGGSIGSTLGMWQAQIEALAADHRVIAYDHRGHGGSPAPAGPYTIAELAADVIGLLDALHVDRAHFVGLSLGGMVAQHVAAHCPDRVDRLALLCTVAHDDDRTGWRDRATTVRRAGTGAVSDVTVERWLTADYRRAHPDVVAHWRAVIASVDREGYAGCCEAIAAMDLRPVLARIRAPTLVLAGTDDPAIPREQVRATAAAIPAASFAVVPGAHVPTIEHPEAVTRAVLAHLT